MVCHVFNGFSRFSCCWPWLFPGTVGPASLESLRLVATHIVPSESKCNKVKPSEVPSPTFNIVNEYEINEIAINHYDLFKLKDPKEIHNIGLFENNLDCKNGGRGDAPQIALNFKEISDFEGPGAFLKRKRKGWFPGLTGGI